MKTENWNDAKIVADIALKLHEISRSNMFLKIAQIASGKPPDALASSDKVTPKFCFNCKYYSDSDVENAPRCLHEKAMVNYTDLVSGKTSQWQNSCRDMRRHKKDCGEQASLFESRVFPCVDMLRGTPVKPGHNLFQARPVNGGRIKLFCRDDLDHNLSWMLKCYPDLLSWAVLKTDLPNNYTTELPYE